MVWQLLRSTRKTRTSLGGRKNAITTTKRGRRKKEFVFVGDEQRWQQQQQQRRKSATKTATPETSPTTATTRRRRSSRGSKHRTRTTLSTMALLAARWLGAFGTSHSAVGAFSACSGRATERGQLDSVGGGGGEGGTDGVGGGFTSSHSAVVVVVGVVCIFILCNIFRRDTSQRPRPRLVLVTVCVRLSVLRYLV